MLPNILVPGIVKIINDAHVFASNCVLDEEDELENIIREYMKEGKYKEIRAAVLDYYINFLNEYSLKDVS